MPHTFSAEQWLPYPVELAFAFFANPDNLPRLMPAWQRAHIDRAIFTPPPPRPPDTPQLPGLVAGAGTRITLTFRALPFFPLRLPWDAEISEFLWNDHFCDVIAGRGPFKSWNHCHQLRASPDPTGRSSSAGTPPPGSCRLRPPLRPARLYRQRDCRTPPDRRHLPASAIVRQRSSSLSLPRPPSAADRMVLVRRRTLLRSAIAAIPAGLISPRMSLAAPSSAPPPSPATQQSSPGLTSGNAPGTRVLRAAPLSPA